MVSLRYLASKCSGFPSMWDREHPAASPFLEHRVCHGVDLMGYTQGILHLVVEDQQDKNPPTPMFTGH